MSRAEASTPASSSSGWACWTVTWSSTFTGQGCAATIYDEVEPFGGPPTDSCSNRAWPE
jgi:hypothetical protein